MFFVTSSRTWQTHSWSGMCMVGCIWRTWQHSPWSCFELFMADLWYYCWHCLIVQTLLCSPLTVMGASQCVLENMLGVERRRFDFSYLRNKICLVSFSCTFRMQWVLMVSSHLISIKAFFRNVLEKKNKNEPKMRATNNKIFNQNMVILMHRRQNR